MRRASRRGVMVAGIVATATIVAGCGSASVLTSKHHSRATAHAQTARQRVQSRTTSRTAIASQQGYLGVETVTISPDALQEALPTGDESYTDYESGLPESGVLVEAVEAHGPAAAAGIHGAEGSPLKQFGGDVITGVDGIALGSAGELSALIASLGSGRVASLLVARAFEESSATEEPRFVYEPPAAVSIKLGVRPSTLPRVKSLGTDCESTEVRSRAGRTMRVHLFADGGASCATASRVVKEYAAGPEEECRGSGCGISLPTGWDCIGESPAGEQITGIVYKCTSGSDVLSAFRAIEPSRG